MAVGRPLGPNHLLKCASKTTRLQCAPRVDIMVPGNDTDFRVVSQSLNGFGRQPQIPCDAIDLRQIARDTHVIDGLL